MTKPSSCWLLLNNEVLTANCSPMHASGASRVPKQRRWSNPTPTKSPYLNRIKQVFALTLCALLIGGCASRPVKELPDLSSWQTRRAVLASQEEWEFAGRIAVSSGEDGFNGKLRWTQDQEQFNATVSGPLGIGTVRIEGAGQRAVLTDKDGVRTELKNVEQELLYRYGWTIPIESLRFWALGIPDPQADAQTELNEDDQLARLEQDGWLLTIPSYRSSSDQSLPHRLSAVKKFDASANRHRQMEVF